MPAIYCVAPDRALLVKRNGTRKVLKGRTVVSPADFPGDELKKHIKNGFIVRENAESEAESEKAVSMQPDGTLAELPPEAPIVAVGLWNVDPKKIATKTLEQLNVMIAEKNPATPPAADIAGAIKTLSADFRG